MSSIDEPLSITITCHHCGEVAATIMAVPCECHDGATKEPLFGMHFDYDFPGVGRDGSFESGVLGEKLYQGLKKEGASYFDSKDNQFLHYGICGFYCSICMKSYCHKCWKGREVEEIGGMEGTITSIYAVCPRGHRNELREDIH